ncbi:DNA primase [Schaalia sp. Marseille-Q2122]|uniref:DNA primase n=1 Tax=Schaalia sp. Marseille-Q2122 TaxID=2736604 RepID=UPI0015891ABA|nr:DNA primase [Schaalia sp. Marseille-Q2122]
MATEPRKALDELIDAFRLHFEVANSDVDVDSDELLDAEERLSDAFFTYDDVLFTSLGVELPFDILDEDDFDEDFDDEDDLDDLDDDDEDDDEDDDLLIVEV